MNWTNVKDHAAECCVNIRHLAILNYLIEVGEPRTLFQIMDKFDHKELTTDTIEMGKLGLIDMDRAGFVPTKFALAIRADLNEIEKEIFDVKDAPPAKETTTISEEDDFYKGRSVTLSKEGEDHLEQINSTGFWDGDKWIGMESWINILNLKKEFRYSASRFSYPFEEVLKDYTDEGWVIVEDHSAKG